MFIVTFYSFFTIPVHVCPISTPKSHFKTNTLFIVHVSLFALNIMSEALWIKHLKNLECRPNFTDCLFRTLTTYNVGSISTTLNQHWTNIRWMSRVCRVVLPTSWISLHGSWRMRDGHRLQVARAHLPCAGGELCTAQQKQNNCIPFIQCWTNVEDVGLTLYECYTKWFVFAGR